jgi:hypothetical protein
MSRSSWKFGDPALNVQFFPERAPVIEIFAQKRTLLLADCGIGAAFPVLGPRIVFF